MTIKIVLESFHHFKNCLRIIMVSNIYCMYKNQNNFLKIYFRVLNVGKLQYGATDEAISSLIEGLEFEPENEKILVNIYQHATNLNIVKSNLNKFEYGRYK